MRNRKICELVSHDFSTKIRDDATRQELNMLRISAIFMMLIYGTVFAIALEVHGNLGSHDAISIILGFLCTFAIVFSSTEELKSLDLFLECSKALKEKSHTQESSRPF